MEKERLEGNIRIDLTGTDPTGWVERKEIEQTALELLCQVSSNRYCPDPHGLWSVRKVLAKQFGNLVPPENWFLCASTSEAYSLLFTLLCDPGDEVVLHRPSYPLLDDLARHGGLNLIDTPLRVQGGLWVLDIGQLERALARPRVRVFSLVQPGNPTGWFLSPAERSKVVALCSKHHVALISDEVFAEYTYVPGFQSLLGESRCLTITLSGLSKGFGLPGFKLGWMGLSGGLEEVSEARERLERLNDSLLSASTPVQNALAGLWEIKADLLNPLKDRLETNRSTWANFPWVGVQALPVNAGWMGILKLEHEETVCHKLFDQGILVQPGFLFDLPWDGVVVSLMGDPVVFREGLQLLQDLVVSLLRS